MFANNYATISDDSAVRRNAAGDAWTSAGKYAGDFVRLAPSGVGGISTEVFVKASRGVRTAGVDLGVADDLAVSLYARPRYLGLPS